MLLSGVGTNAIGFDLSPEASFARHMSNQGFDTWIVEVRGAGLSSHNNFKSNEHIPSENVVSDSIEYTEQECQNGSSPGQKELDKTGSKKELDVSIVEGDKTDTQTSESELQSASQLNDALMVITEKISDYLSESQSKEKNSNMLEESRYSIASNQIRDLRQRFLNILDEVQRSISPPFLGLRRRFSETIEDFQKQLDFVLIYDWDFDHYLEEDIPIAIEYIKSYTKPKDGKLLAIGHSMGGILLYAMLSRCGFKGRESEFAAVVTLASSLDYASSQSSLKLLLPLANPADALNVPIVPLGTLMAAAYPLASSPPYVLSWLNPHVSAKDMMCPELFEKLCLNNFCTIPTKLLLQLSSVFRDGGLRDRYGIFCYKDHIHKGNTPVFALAGDQDLICPPEAVYETVKLIPQHLVSYKLFGKPEGPHYGHFDIVGGRMVQDEVYPCIVEFLCQHDGISEVWPRN